MISKMFPKAKVTDEMLKNTLPLYDINTPERAAMFLAQCGHESAGFTALLENLNYSAEALVKVFPKYFNTNTAQQYARKPQAIANKVYANRMGNGDEASGDGWKFRGHGFIQLTGKMNITAFANSISMPVDAALELMTAPSGALQAACWFWQVNKLNRFADTKDVKGCTKAINGGYNGLEDRQRLYKELLND